MPIVLAVWLAWGGLMAVVGMHLTHKGTPTWTSCGPEQSDGTRDCKRKPILSEDQP